MNLKLLLRTALIPSLAAGTAFAQSAAAPPPTQVPVSALSVGDPGLEVTVWAQSPQIHNPTNLDFDKDGRIWVAEGVNYRSHYNRQPEGDRIVVLEDTDGDGRADKEGIFVQEPDLRAPMGLAVLDNRVIVSMAPNIILYTDVNRDRRFDPAVDKREIILTGFNGRKHDHTVHSVTIGPDGQWYWNAGNCGAMFTDKSGKTFRIGSAYDPTYGGGKADLGWEPTKIAGSQSDDGHVWIGGFAARMNPDGSGVHIIGHNFRNSYEQTVTSFGDVFQNDNDDPPACRTAFLLESGNAGFCSFDGKRSWGADRRPGQSVPVAEWRQEDPGTMPAGDVYGGGSPTGIAFVEDSALGAKYRGLLLSCEPGRNVVFGYLPKPLGAGFELKRFDFLTSNREGDYSGTDFKGGRNDKRDLKTMFRPSDVGVGADGAIYVADWFDGRVGGHADWDETLSGTIYRIAPKGFKPRIPKVDFTTLDGAIAGLRSPAVNVRGAAQEALVARGSAAVKPVAALLKDPNPYVQARAVWILARNPGPGLDRVASLLKASDPQMRVVAFRALRRAAEDGRVPATAKAATTPGTRDFLLTAARRLSSDPSPAVRREVAVAMRDEPIESSREILAELAERFDGKDRTYLEAWGTGATGKESALYPEVARRLGTSDPAKWSPAFEWLAWRLHVPASIPDFKARALSKSLDDASRKRALTALGYNGSPDAANAVLEVAAQSDGAIKAEALWWLLNRKGSTWKDAGLDTALQKRGIYDPENVALIEATIPAADAPKFAVADVLNLQGNAKQGAERFTAICASCHRAGDVGTEYAPNLTGWAGRQTAEVLLNSVINPSAEIASGFNGTEVKTKDGLVIQGLLLSEGDPLIVQSAGGLTQMIPRQRVASRKGLDRSLMMSADQLGVSPQDLADIAAFLRTR
ncbi:MAG: PVC-type heme-binding CxxCH protein [Verrucomicrobiota bacterium]